MAELKSHYKKVQEAFLGKSLSPRQDEIMRLMVEGWNNKQIAIWMGVSHQTIKNHNAEIFGRLGVTDKTNAVLAYIREHPDLIRTLVP